MLCSLIFIYCVSFDKNIFILKLLVLWKYFAPFVSKNTDIHTNTTEAVSLQCRKS